MYLRFGNGVGDNVNFVHLLNLYRKRGWRIACDYAYDKKIIWDAIGVEYRDRTASIEQPNTHPWLFFLGFNEPVAEHDWSGSRISANLNRNPLPVIKEPFEKLWDELCQDRLDFTHLIPNSIRDTIQSALDTLPKPIMLLHTSGVTMGKIKDLPRESVPSLCWKLLDATHGSIVILDSGNKNPIPAHPRIKIAREMLKNITLTHLAGLLDTADILIGVDSGPYHMARMTKIPTIGVWPSLYPSCNALPNSQAINMVPNDMRFKLVNIARAPRWNIVEYEGLYPDPDEIVRHATRMLQGPRYLNKELTGRDAMMQHWTRDLTSTNAFDQLLREIKSRFPEPDIVEVGSSRYRTDWHECNSTYLLAALADSLGGTFTCLDRDISVPAKQCKHWSNAKFMKTKDHSGDHGGIDVLFVRDKKFARNVQGLREDGMIVMCENGNVTIHAAVYGHVLT